MRWALFAAGLLVIYVVTRGVWFRFPLLAPVDLFLTYALVCALFARAPDAGLAGWIVGLAQDLGSEGPVGIHAVSLGLAGVIVASLRETFNVRVWWPRWLTLFGAAAPAAVLVGLYRHFWRSGGELGLAAVLGGALWIALIAATLALLVTAVPGVALDRRPRFSAGTAR